MKFVDSYATHQLLPPYLSTDSEVQVFLFRLEKAIIAKYCDNQFNIGNARHRKYFYAPMESAQFGAIIVTKFPNLCSQDPVEVRKYTQYGNEFDHLSMTQINVMVPIYRYKLSDHNIVCDGEVVWYEALIVTDSPTWQISNYEILGNRSLWGELKFAREEPYGGFHFSADILMWRVFDPKSEQKVLPFLLIDTGPGIPAAEVFADAKSAGMDGADTVEFVDQLKASLPGISDIIEGRQEGGLNTVCLKQFRDARHASKAIYQALVGATAHYTNVSDLRFFNPAHAAVTFYTGAMVDQILGRFMGLTITNAEPDDHTGGTHTTPSRIGLPVPVSVGVAFGFKADVRFDNYETLHQFPV